MSQLFKLDINEYSISEMRGLLNLESPCSIEDICRKEKQLQEKLLKDTSITASKKQEILVFLSQVKAKLINTEKKGSTLLGGDHAIIPRVYTQKARTKVDAFIAPNLTASSQPIPDPHLRRNLLCLDSRFRDNYYTTLSTDYMLTLPTKIKNVVSMELAAFDFPNTYYQVSKSLGNNFFWMGWAVPDLSGADISGTSMLNWFYIAIPDGNYKREEIQHVINEQITIATQKGLYMQPEDNHLYHYSDNTPPPQCIIDSVSAKTVFAISNWNDPHDPNDISHTQGHGAQQLELIFNGARGAQSSTRNSPFRKPPSLDLTGAGGIISNFGWILGYRMAEYTSSQAYVSEGCYDAWGTKYTYIVVDDFNKSVNNFVLPSYNSSIGKSNILARISMIAASTDNFSDGLSLNNQFANPDAMIKKRTYFGPVDIQRLHIQILDEFGRIMDLNNMDLAIALDLVCLYD